MPWSIEARDGKFCVVKDDDGDVEGCHDSRVQAVKQQRALYANESRMAAMYADLDANTDEWVEPAAPVPAAAPQGVLSPLASELVGMLLKDEREKSLIASLATSMDRIADHVGKTDEERAALVAALGQVSQPIVNVPAPVVNVEAAPAPNVTVEAAPAPNVTVEAAPAPNVTVQAAEAPVVHVHQPRTSKTVTFERDPITGDVSKAEVTEA